MVADSVYVVVVVVVVVVLTLLSLAVLQLLLTIVLILLSCWFMIFRVLQIKNTTKIWHFDYILFYSNTHFTCKNTHTHTHRREQKNTHKNAFT